MTLVVAVAAAESVWMMADRQLGDGSTGATRLARKLAFVAPTADTTAIVGYSGLGRTASGVEPSDWIVSSLRGRQLGLGDHMAVLAEAAKNRLPPHLAEFDEGLRSHAFFAVAFEQENLVAYSIEVSERSEGPDGYEVALSEWTARDRRRCCQVFAIGSGRETIDRIDGWAECLRSIVKAYDRGRVTASCVADHMADLNWRCSNKNRTVGKNSIVAWRNRPDGAHSDGGAHRLYVRKSLQRNTPPLPTLAGSIDFDLLDNATERLDRDYFAAVWRGEEPSFDSYVDAIREAAAQVDNRPDDRLP